jgi:hypothetical protein
VRGIRSGQLIGSSSRSKLVPSICCMLGAERQLVAVLEMPVIPLCEGNVKNEFIFTADFCLGLSRRKVAGFSEKGAHKVSDTL